MGILKTVTWVGENVTINKKDWQGADVTQVYFQGVFLGGVMRGDKALLYVGMAGRSGKRVVVRLT